MSIIKYIIITFISSHIPDSWMLVIIICLCLCFFIMSTLNIVSYLNYNKGVDRIILKKKGTGQISREIKKETSLQAGRDTVDR